MSTPEQRIRDFYGFDFPEDFFRFREFVAELKKGLLADATDMHPAQPFDVADGKPAKDRDPSHTPQIRKLFPTISLPRMAR